MVQPAGTLYTTGYKRRGINYSGAARRWILCRDLRAHCFLEKVAKSGVRRMLKILGSGVFVLCVCEGKVVAGIECARMSPEEFNPKQIGTPGFNRVQ